MNTLTILASSIGIGGIVGICFAVLILIICLSNIRIVSQAEEYIVEFLGKYRHTWSAGIHWLIPFFERVSNKVILKEQVLDSNPQPVITKDNVTINIDSVVYFYVFDSKSFTYGAVNPLNALDNLSATTLRNIIGTMTLDDTLTSRDIINGKMTEILDEATDKWGIKVTRCEVKNIILPREIQSAMEKQMKAERERREQILIAEGHKQAAILEAEGKKQAVILEAEASKEAAIQKALGEAQAIKELQEAKALGLKMIKDAEIDDKVLKLRSLEAFEKSADGRSTKIIIPSDIQNMAGVVTSLTEIAKPKQ